MSRPNLFDHAPHELSQDAVLIWLFRYADPQFNEDMALHDVAQKFVRLFLADYDKAINKIELWPQWERIDITVKVNDEMGIVLEDKVGAHIHGDQLSRYRKAGEKWAADEDIKVGYYYLNTENIESDDRNSVEKEGYTIVTRRQILNVLDEYKGHNAILLDFRNRVATMEEETERFRNRPFTEWTKLSWQGFYDWIRQVRNDCTWCMLKPPGTEPFWGVWWNNHSRWINGDVSLYPQIDQGRLTFKMYTELENNREWGYRIRECIERIAAEMNVSELYRTRMSFRGCATMIMAVDPKDYLGEGNVNLEKVLEKFELYEAIIAKCKLELESRDGNKGEKLQP